MIFGSSLIRVLHPCVVIMMFSCLLGSCKVGVKTEHEEIEEMNFELTIAQAEKLVSLPLNCVTKPFPYKSGHVLSKKNDLDLPQVHHPAFYGCFDWHSSVHGHWVMVYLLKRFPEMNQADTVMIILKDHFRSENIAREIDYFDMNRYTASFERTYGWAWLLKLANELESWDNPEATQLFKNLKPLADLICQKYMEYLPKLNYPIRVGEHSNTAFGLTFAYDYAANTGQDSLLELISKRARDYYLYDRNCPSSWEPSGYDFLSPCLEEADIMRRILEREKFKSWLGIFLPDLLKSEHSIFNPVQVSDRSDGKLVHLDGLNFSRAWCLYGISRDFPEWVHLRRLADQHLAHSLPQITDGDYAGEHWLGTFALNALVERDKSKN